MKGILVTLILVFVAFLCEAVGEEVSDHSRLSSQHGKRLIHAFNYDGVKLLPSMHQTQLQQVRDYYMRLRPNDVLRGFRLKHKDWAPGKDLGGAYSERPLACRFLPLSEAKRVLTSRAGRLRI